MRAAGRLRVAAFAVAVSVPGLAFSADPNAMDGDVVFSLPCETSITFRRIVTSREDGNDAILADRRVRLGSPDENQAYLNYLRTDYVDGHFRDTRSRYYLMAKYEVSEAQYSALMAEDCNRATAGSDMPKTRVNWYDAVDFTRRLTKHLLAQQRQAVTAAAGTTEILARLPTEAEWEFAARGGLAVSLPEFQAKRFPMRGELADYAWHNAPISAQGQPEPVGQLSANPLGLFDIFGNADELVLEPFRLNKAGRAHGLAGAYMMKGGSFQDNATYLSSALRKEVSAFDTQTGEELRLRTVGLRPVIGAPVLAELGDVNRLATEWNEAGRGDAESENDPLEIIEGMRERTSDRAMINDLGTIEQAIRVVQSQNSESGTVLMEGLLLNAGRIVLNIRELYKSNNARRRLLASVTGLSDDDIRVIQGDIRRDEDMILLQNDFSHDAFLRIADAFGSDVVTARADTLANELRFRNLPELAGAVVLTAKIVNRTRSIAAGEGDDVGERRSTVLSLTLNGLESP